jgi:hypothetical protein
MCVMSSSLSGVTTFLSRLIVTMTWLHCSAPLGLNVNVSFPANVELYDPSCNINRGFGVQKWPPKNEWYLMTDIHLEYHKVHMYERIPDSHRDIFHNSHWMPDRLIRQLQIHGSWDQAIMFQLIIDFLWHDAHACSEITEGLIKLLGANQIRDGWNT